MKMEQMMVGNMAVYCYIVWCDDTKEALVIDPGGDVTRIMESLADKGLTLKYIVNTHGHSDHTAGNGELKELTNAEIVMHTHDHELLKLPEVQAIGRQLGFEPSPPADVTVKDHDDITVGNVSLKVIHTPGHTPGGMCLLADGQLFTGDTLFVGGIGRTDLPGSSHEQFIRSLKERLITLPDATVVWPGHDYGPNPSSTIGLEKTANPFLRQLS